MPMAIENDLMDDGRVDVPLSEYEQYVSRFNRTFPLSGTPAFYLPGNHDVGLYNPGWFSTDARQRFEHAFGPTNQFIHMNDRLFVFIDAQRLVEEEQNRRASGLSHQDVLNSEQSTNSVIRFVKQVADDYASKTRPRVLLSHIPLARPRHADCGPLREKGAITRGYGIGYQNLLEEDTTQFLLENLKPTVIFSGDDHDYCELSHTYNLSGSPDGAQYTAREVSIKSFSMAMGIHRPGFQILSIPANTNSSELFDRPCNLPNQIGLYLRIYLPAIICAVALLALSRASSLDAGIKGHSWEEELLMGEVDGEIEQDKFMLPTTALTRPQRSVHFTYAQRVLLILIPSRWRPYACRSSGPLSQSQVVAFLLMDIVEVGWPVLTAYVLVSLFILW